MGHDAWERTSPVNWASRYLMTAVTCPSRSLQIPVRQSPTVDPNPTFRCVQSERGRGTEEGEERIGSEVPGEWLHEYLQTTKYNYLFRRGNCKTIQLSVHLLGHTRDTGSQVRLDGHRTSRVRRVVPLHTPSVTRENPGSFQRVRCTWGRPR